MSLRETINKKQSTVMWIAGAVAVLAIGLIAWQVSGRHQTAASSTKAFYTDDGGKSFFKDDINKISPWDHDGKQAYRCDVFKAGDKEIVGLIYRHNANGKTAMEAYLNSKAKDKDKDGS